MDCLRITGSVAIHSRPNPIQCVYLLSECIDHWLKIATNVKQSVFKYNILANNKTLLLTTVEFSITQDWESLSQM